MVRWWVTTAADPHTTAPTASVIRLRRCSARAARLVSASTHRNSAIAMPS